MRLHLRVPPRRGTALLAAVSALALPLALTGPAGAAVGADGAVSVDRPYVKANSRTPSATDAIRDCGANRRQQNEPTSAVDPSRPTVVTSGSNDYCTVDKAGGTWTGFYRSTNQGASWTDSLLPGYPTDDSPEGTASPLHRKGITNAGDPVQAWDRSGRLFYMGNAFNRVAPQNGSVWVATYDQHAAHYVRTVIVGKGAPALTGKFNDKTSIEVDRGSRARTPATCTSPGACSRATATTRSSSPGRPTTARRSARRTKLSEGVAGTTSSPTSR